PMPWPKGPNRSQPTETVGSTKNAFPPCCAPRGADPNQSVASARVGMPTQPPEALTVDRWNLTRDQQQRIIQITRRATGQGAGDDLRENSCGAHNCCGADIETGGKTGLGVPTNDSAGAWPRRLIGRPAVDHRDQLSSRGGGAPGRPAGIPEATNFATA